VRRTLIGWRAWFARGHGRTTAEPYIVLGDSAAAESGDLSPWPCAHRVPSTGASNGQRAAAFDRSCAHTRHLRWQCVYLQRGQPRRVFAFFFKPCARWRRRQLTLLLLRYARTRESGRGCGLTRRRAGAHIDFHLLVRSARRDVMATVASQLHQRTRSCRARRARRAFMCLTGATLREQHCRPAG
jgi:hypothetical protein